MRLAEREGRAVADLSGTTAGRQGEPGSEREERVQAVLRELERRFGPWVVYRLTDARPAIGERAIASGALSLDLATGIGGFPRGRITEVLGPASSGKRILACHLLANAQRQRGFVAFIDATQRANFEQMARCGVDLADLLLVVPQSIREVLDVAALLVESGGLDALVSEPLADLVNGSVQVARSAAEHLARLNALMHPSPTAVVLLTDSRARSPCAPFTQALRHFAALRIQLTPLQLLPHPSGDVLGLRVRAQTIKNKLAPPQRLAEFDVRRDRGIHREADLVDLARACGVLDEQPLGICFGNHFLGRGRAQAIATLESEPALAQALQDAIRRVWGV
jgi:recombination protein RecA